MRAIVLLLYVLGSELARVKTADQQLHVGTIENNKLEDIKETVRQELRHGLSREVDSYMQTLTTRQDNQNHLALLQDLREVVAYHDGMSRRGTSKRRLSTGMSHEKTDNISSLLNNDGRKVNRHRLHDCAAIRKSGQTTSGVFTISPLGGAPLRVYCDMETRGGGWTVIQRRLNGEVDFFRNWLEYAEGFGSAEGEYWLGNRALYLLTHSHVMDLHVYLADLDGNSRMATYSNFAVSSEFTHFSLDIGSYTGTAGDALAHSRGHKFSTKDKDNDAHPDDDCSNKYSGGWWYNACYRANLNGRYLNGTHRGHQGINWNHWRGDSYSLKQSVMMIRPASFSPDTAT